MCVFITYCSTYYKAVREGGGGFEDREGGRVLREFITAVPIIKLFAVSDFTRSRGAVKRQKSFPQGPLTTINIFVLGPAVINTHTTQIERNDAQTRRPAVG
jgi:hypothetical protein